MIKKGFSLLLTMALFCGMLTLNGCGKKQAAKVTYPSCETPAFFDGELKCDDDFFISFARYSINEATRILEKEKNISLKMAEKLLATQGYTVETTFDKSIFQSTQSAFLTVLKEESTPFSSALVDMNGAVLSIYSSFGQTDFANTPTFAGSVIKPLSVYAPIIDKGLANWSSVQLDEPVKKVVSGTELEDWPQNADGKYSGTNITVAKAVKHSTNTVAVKWLKALGVNNSINFLEESFGFDLSEERKLIADYSEDEVLGNVALGYLRGGLTSTELAASYRIFAGDGKYIAPYTVTKITDLDGKTVYDIANSKPEYKQIIKKETSTIMNRMLKTVTETGGTGEAAAKCGVNVVGKTGTTDNNDNWFVGLSPEYICAVWYSNTDTENRKNKAPDVFSEIMKAVTTDKSKNFSISNDVVTRIYCDDSGQLLSENCYKMESGWFSYDNLPKECSIHKGE